MRTCPGCKGELKHIDGWEKSSSERGGNPLEVDIFLCMGCGIQYRHSVDERFTGDIHGWWQRASEADEWDLMEEKDWPDFGK